MRIVIGIDQSYKNTGISIAVDGELKSVTSVWLEKLSCNSERREVLRSKLSEIARKMCLKKEKYNCELIVIIERIRLQSKGFLNIDYIKSIGALNALIVDVFNSYGIKVYSVDTRSWKSQVVGTSKPQRNKYGVPEEKWPTMKFLWGLGYKEQLMYEVSKQNKKNVYELNGKKYRFNDDAADSACIALYGFAKDKKLEEEH